MLFKIFGSTANSLHDASNLAFIAIAVRDGDGDALAVLVHAQDDKLSRLVLAGNERGLDVERLIVGGNEFG